MRDELRERAIEVIDEASKYGCHQLPFEASDVKSVKHFDERNADSGEPDWSILFETKDARFAVFHGGHDYTGWD